MDKQKLVEQLMNTFIEEMKEQLCTFDNHLLSLEKQPDHDDLWKVVFRVVHTMKGAARSVSIFQVETLCHQIESILSSILENECSADQTIFELLFESTYALTQAVKCLEQKRNISEHIFEDIVKKLATWSSKNEPSKTPKENTVSKQIDQSNTSVLQTSLSKKTNASPISIKSRNSVRVYSSKLDSLISQSNEFLQACKRWDNYAVKQETADPQELKQNNKRFEHGKYKLLQVASALHEEICKLRMLPFSEACQGLERTIRDLARSSGKEVDVLMQGTEIELDRAVLDGLIEPLLHLVRNAVDHGIEKPDKRSAQGKRRQGKISIVASVRGRMVTVAISDDGQGIDEASIYQKASEYGLSDLLEQKDLSSILFHPGFSTATSITEVSGRGMGLDIVKNKVEALNGFVNVSSQKGTGTTFSMTVPLTLGLLKALIVTANNSKFALLSDAIVRLYEVSSADIAQIGGRSVLSLTDMPVPIMSLQEIMGMSSKEITKSNKKTFKLVVVSSGDKKIALIVDDVLSEQEILVKALSSRIIRTKAISAATILSTGEIAFVLNSSELLKDKISTTTSITAHIEDKNQPKRLLIAEDSFTTRTLEKNMLEEAGYEVLATVDGTEAWRALQQNNVDLIISDVEMPGMDGFALTKLIRSSQKFRNLPVILVTSLEKEKDRLHGIQIGANAYLAKSSFDQRNLLKTIKQLL